MARPVSYWPLLGLATLANLFVVPSFSIVRQALIHAVPDEHRTSLLAIDSVVVEISFMIGPIIGVLLATYTSTPWALFGCELTSVLGGVLIWVMNPPLRDRSELAGGGGDGTGARSWLTPASVGVLLAG